MENLKSLVAWMWTMHMLWAIWFTTGVFSSSVVQALIKRTADPDRLYFGFRLLWRLAVIFIIPGLLIAGALGFYLVTAFQLGFGVGWVQASIVMYLFVLIAILFVQIPYFRKALRVAEAAQKSGGPVAELTALAQAKLPAILTHVNALLIVIMIILMAMKPVPAP